MNKAIAGLGTTVVLALGSLASAQTAAIEPFAATDLAGVSGIVTAFLGVGALVTLGFTLYRKGRQASNKV